jgi:ribosomal protein S18 acetylase RimI-like enzyme
MERHFYWRFFKIFKNCYNVSTRGENNMIRRATEKDIEGIKNLLNQVLQVHADIRPDLFKENSRKYNDLELLQIIRNDQTPIFVYTNENDEVVAHAFLEIRYNSETNNMYASKELYIDDLCVEKSLKGKHIGSTLFEYVKQYASLIKCDFITLNVWEGNLSAMNFYKHKGLKPRKHCLEMKLD